MKSWRKSQGFCLPSFVLLQFFIFAAHDASVIHTVFSKSDQIYILAENWASEYRNKEIQTVAVSFKIRFTETKQMNEKTTLPQQEDISGLLARAVGVSDLFSSPFKKTY